MNNLSWFLYLADVLPNYAWLGTVGAFMAFVLILGGGLVAAILLDYEPALAGKVLKYISRVGPVLVLLTLVTFAIPSKETIYLIAGSEAGETVVTSEEGREILSDIHEVIKHQLNEMKGETK